MTPTNNSPGSNDQQPDNRKELFFELPPNNTFTDEKEEGVEPYVFSNDIALIINVAHITKRPLLIEGKPGCGKSRLAEALAAIKGWHFLYKSITSRTTLEDLTNDFDHLQRLHDAYSAGPNNKSMQPEYEYNRPGIFWWAFNHMSAKDKGKDTQKQHSNFKGFEREQDNGANHTVLLIDEIDKAEPDLPNDLLDTLERKRIEMRDGSFIDSDPATETFTIITSNRERTLPAAFLRRCVYLYIDEPNKTQLKKIARSHFGDEPSESLINSLAQRVINYRKAETDDLRVPGTSEFIDALRVCLEKEIKPGRNHVWHQIENAILRKKI